MRKLLLAASAIGALGMTALSVPAKADYVGVGPLGVHVGRDHDHDWRYRHGWRGDYARGDCRVVRDRVETPSGRVIFKTRRICD